MNVVYDGIRQLLTLVPAATKEGRHPQAADLGIIENAAVVVERGSGLVAWLGPKSELPTEYANATRETRAGTVWLPALSECHTHILYGGTRHHDYALRVAGKTYQQVAAEGGGILSTLKHTRAASREQLQAGAAKHLEAFARYGVGAVEIKSGYGLTLESEILALECVPLLQQACSAKLVSTFLPAHATPPEFNGRTDDYVDEIIRNWIPEVARRKLAIFFDAFVEEGYFSVAQTKRLCEAARAHGFQVKLHCEQFVDLGSTSLAVDIQATSCDHLDNISDANIKKLAGSMTVAVLLPGASVFTGTPYPPARKLLEAGARVALSTDFNPGTCPSHNLLLMTTLACSTMKMTVPEAIVAVTYNAAAALGLEKECGTLQVGSRLRVCEVDAESYEQIPYSFGEVTARLVI